MSIFNQLEDEAKAAVTKIVTVRQKPATGAKSGRVLFEGLAEDAAEFITNNFPRIHSEEAGPDYYTEETEA